MMDFSLLIKRFLQPHISYGLLSSFITDLRVEEEVWLAHPVTFRWISRKVEFPAIRGGYNTKQCLVMLIDTHSMQ